MANIELFDDPVHTWVAGGVKEVGYEDLIS
jgi:hypothetical protein